MLNQRKFIFGIKHRHNKMQASKCPFSKGIKLSNDEGEVLNDLDLYRSIIRRLLYLNLTRPDISYSVQQLSQFMTKPRKPHLQAAIQVIKYLSGTVNQDYFITKPVLNLGLLSYVTQIGAIVLSVSDH